MKAPALLFEAMSSQNRTAYRQRWKSLPLAALRSLQKELDQIIKTREAAAKSDADIAAEVDDPILIHSFSKKKVRRGKRKWLQQMRLYCCTSHCPECPHGPYWFLFRFDRSRNVVVARAHEGPALPPETMDFLKEGIRPGMPYTVELESNKGGVSFEHKVAELKVELEKLPADRQEQLAKDLEKGKGH
jgi:hypothetical protein